MKLLGAILGLFVMLVVAGPAAADDPPCGAEAGLDEVVVGCQTDGEKLGEQISSAPAGTRYKVEIKCVSDQADAVCNNPVTCDSPPGSVRYDVYRSTDGGATYTKISEACLTSPPDTEPQLTPGDVAVAFRALTWPESPLQIQPPGGRTLVNLETNFFTTNTQPSTQTVVLLGQSVEIEATPTSWTWNHGDGTSQTTDEAGAAYPALDITHTYVQVSDAVAPSVDTTYSGRYRVNGGDWAAIPATVTVAGAAGQLEIVPAKPQLVGAD